MPEAGRIVSDDQTIGRILQQTRTIAMLGASPNEVRPSFFVLKYLLGKGYSVFPINPGHAGKAICGRTVYGRLADVPEPIDMVDVFRAPDALPGIVDETIALKPRPKVIWTQLGVRNQEAAERAAAAGLCVVMNRCPKIEFGRLSGEIGWTGVNAGQISARRPRIESGVQQLGLPTRD